MELSQNDEVFNSNIHLKALEERLSVLHKGILESDENSEAKYDIVKEFIRKFIRDSLESSTKAEVDQQLHDLCYKKMLIPSKLYEWTFEVFKEMSQVSDSAHMSSKFIPPSPYSEISKRTLPNAEVNNCLLLCNMVSCCDQNNYISFLHHQDHDFDEVSFSVLSNEELNYYACAKNESRKEFYVAFLGERNLSDWQKYTTFNEGRYKYM